MKGKQANRLIHATSPYLLQHAYNPVDWYTWGPEALQKAKDENKPILLSIGYSACHWCHVMERESFENEDTAAIMNAHFINIKVDREERPDLDHIYMDAVQAMTGSGGWPLNVFLTPDLKPFYGGTYFPPVNAFNRKSWREVLYLIKNAFDKRKDEIEDQASQLTDYLINANQTISVSQSDAGVFFTKENMEHFAKQMLMQADTAWGGFGKAPKFPQTFSLNYLLQVYHFSAMQSALDQVCLSLDKMYMGGLFDHLGGGFARYSTDAQWLAPHFEKMLYDNALLTALYADAYKLTKQASYKQVVEDTIDFVLRELKHPAQFFYSALDADSEGVEGKYYTWSLEEVMTILGEDAGWFCSMYDVSEKGNWEHTNILWLQKPLQVYAAAFNISSQKLEDKIKTARVKLMAVRNNRIRPLLDDKIILGWNAMMITALCNSAGALQREEWLDQAESAFAALKQHLFSDGNWYHNWKDGQQGHAAFLDDYALLADACLQLFYSTGKNEYIEQVEQIIHTVAALFDTPESLMYFYTDVHATDIILRKQEFYDGATASGNSIMAHVLLQAGILLDKPAWVERGRAMVLIMSKMIREYPNSFGKWMTAFIKMSMPGVEVAVIGDEYKNKLIQMQAYYFPQLIIHGAEKSDKKFALLAEKIPQPGSTQIYVCSGYRCHKPVDTVELAAELIGNG